MAMLDTSKINYAFKKIFGKLHTDNQKEVYNEARFSGYSISSTTVWGAGVPTNPDNSSLYAITGGVVEFLRLELIPDPSSNGHAFIARLPADYETNSTNPRRGTAPFVNGQELSLTAGKLQMIPPLYGLTYEAKPYRGGTATKGSGTLVAPGDVVDLIVDYFAGTVFQENSPDTSPTNMTYLETFIWSGPFVSEVIESGQTDIGSIITRANNINLTGGVEAVVDYADTTKYSTIKWIISAQNPTTQLVSSEILASKKGSATSFTQYAVNSIGNPASDFAEFDVDSLGNSIRLKVTPNNSNIYVNVVRINVI